MPAAPASRSAHPDQQEIDFLMPFGPMRTLLSPAEVARCLGRSVQHVYDLIDEGKLEAHAPTDREKSRYRITRRSVLVVLAETALYRSEAHLPRVLATCRTLTTRAEILAAQRQLAEQLNKTTR